MATILTAHLPTLVLSSVIFQSFVCSASRDAATLIQRRLRETSMPTATASKFLRRQETSTATIIENGSTIMSVETSEVVVTVSPSSVPPVIVSTTITSSQSPTSDPVSSTSSDSSTSSSTPSSSTQNSSTGTITQTPTPTCSSGYFLCDPVFNGGCCRSGFQCTSNACIAPSSITDTRSCETGSFLCPASLNFGCCPNGYQCDFTACIAATGTDTPTSTVPPSVSADTTAADGSSGTTSGVIPKATDENISSKIAPSTPTPTSSGTSQSNKLSAPTIGGIAAGVFIAVAAIAIMLYFTFRRLRQRGNLEPIFGGFDRHHKRYGSPIPLGAPTTNAYDPNSAGYTSQPDARKSGMPDYYPTYMKTAARLPERPPPRLREPILPQVSPHVDGGFDFGFNQPGNEIDGEHTRHHGSEYQSLPSEESDIGQGGGNHVSSNGSGGSTRHSELHEPREERPRPSSRHVSWSTEAPG